MGPDTEIPDESKTIGQSVLQSRLPAGPSLFHVECDTKTSIKAYFCPGTPTMSLFLAVIIIWYKWTLSKTTANKKDRGTIHFSLLDCQC